MSCHVTNLGKCTDCQNVLEVCSACMESLLGSPDSYVCTNNALGEASCLSEKMFMQRCPRIQSLQKVLDYQQTIQGC